MVRAHAAQFPGYNPAIIPLRPLFSGAGFIGESVPAFKNGDAGGGVTAPSLVALVQRAINLDANAQLVSRLLVLLCPTNNWTT